jgi:hypothetical protein
MPANKLQSLRSLNSDFARAYKYEFIITSPPAGITLPEGVVTKLATHCLNCVVPANGVQAIEVEVGSHTMRLNGRNDTPGVINPEFILEGDYSIYKYFREWENAANPDIGSEVQAPSSDLLATVHIRSKDIKNETQLTNEVVNLWCRNAPEINHADDSNDIVRWAPELVYEFSRVL